MTYDLAFKLYKPFYEGSTVTAAQGKARATTVENYLNYEINAASGAKEAKNVDYYPLPAAVLALAQTGVQEVEY